MNRDFSASLYLGMRHGSGELQDWDSLTIGAPAAFFEASSAVALGKSLARLQGLEKGTLAPSTLHLFWDWFGGLDSRKDIVFADAQIYRVASWGVERAAGKGITTAKFRHQCPASLDRLIRQKIRSGQRPIIVTDGWCPFCGKASPLRDYLQIIEAFKGLLVVDDTQALGILGRNPGPEMQYGYGGGGLLKYLNLKSKQLIVISSLAKAFGVPLAALCGSEHEVQAFNRRSETRVNSSPPSAAALAAGKNALRLNTAFGNLWREELFRNVAFFKKCMAEYGFETNGGFFPVQTIAGIDDCQARRLHALLWKKGIRTVPVLTHGKSSRLCWLLQAFHTEQDIDRACRTLFSITRNPLFFKHCNHENHPRRDIISRNYG